MKNNKLIIGLVIVVLLIIGGYFYFAKSTGVNTNPSTTASSTEYRNDTYGFGFSLPKSWAGYTVVTSTWLGDSLDSSGQVHTNTISGPYVSIRHPEWTAASPRQDIPIYVFTITQWNDMQADKFHIGAAPINPSEIGRNSQYVFGLPARYNFSYLPGYEEVDQILQSHPLHSI